MVWSIFEQPSAEEVWTQFERVVAQLRERFGRAAELLDVGGLHDPQLFGEVVAGTEMHEVGGRA